MKELEVLLDKWRDKQYECTREIQNLEKRLLEVRSQEMTTRHLADDVNDLLKKLKQPKE